METNDKNLKLYPRYRRLARDFLFFYTINVLFLTQVKKIDMSVKDRNTKENKGTLFSFFAIYSILSVDMTPKKSDNFMYYLQQNEI